VYSLLTRRHNRLRRPLRRLLRSPRLRRSLPRAALLTRKPLPDSQAEKSWWTTR